MNLVSNINETNIKINETIKTTKAEAELASLTGVLLPRGPSKRAVARRMVWRPLPEAPSRPACFSEDTAKPWQWLRGRFHQIHVLLRSEAPPSNKEVSQAVPVLCHNTPDWVRAGVPLEVYELAVEVAAEVPVSLSSGCKDALSVAVEAITDRVAMGLAEATVADEKAARAGWKDWVLKALSGGAGIGHKFSKTKEAWKPTSTLRVDGQVVSDPDSLLQAQVEEWANIWQEGALSQEEASIDAVLPPGPPLTKLTSGQLRQASECFSSTVLSFDGFHVSHCKLLTDPALEV